MSGPLRPRVKVDALQDRTIATVGEKKGKKSGHIVRWSLDGKRHSKAFRTQVQADSYRSGLISATNKLVDWDLVNGEPIDEWTPRVVPSIAECARALVEEDWEELAQKSRKSLCEALVRLIEASAPKNAPKFEGDERGPFRAGLNAWLQVSATKKGIPNYIEQWLKKWSPPVNALDPVRLKEIDRRLKLTDGGLKCAKSTHNRYRSGGTKCLTLAVENGYIDDFTWPKGSLGQPRRKKVRSQKARKRRNLENLPNRDQLVAILDALINDQPESHRYKALSAVVGYAGLRPSEAMVLEVGDIHRTRGSQMHYLSVTKTWGGAGAQWRCDDEEVALPKTGETRDVFIPQILVDELKAWCDHAKITSGPMFLNAKGEPPSNWGRSLHCACRKAEVRAITPYGLRHTNATLLMEARVPLGVIAEQLGNSIEVLVDHYLGWLQGSKEEGQHAFELYLGNSVAALPSP